MPPETPMKYTRIVPLTSIRFFAAMLVVIYHYGRSVWPFDEGFLHTVTQCAASGVAFFFFLSGFILAHVYHQAQWAECGVLKRYFISRLARIYPIYVVALITQYLINLKHIYVDRLSIVDSLVGLQVHVFMLQAWLPSQVSQLNIPGWSLSVEVSFYLLFPLIIQRVMAMKQSSVIPAFVILFFSSQGVLLLMRTVIWADWFNASPTIHNFILYYPPLYFSLFILGVLAFRTVHARLQQGESNPRLMALLSIIAVLGIVVSSYWADSKMAYGIHVGMLAPLYGVLLYSLCDPFNNVARMLSSRILEELGEASYSIYILQMPVYHLMLRFVPIQTPWLAFYLYVVVLIGTSYALYRWYESPIRAIARKR